MNIAILMSCYDDPVRDNPNDQYNWKIIYPDRGENGENLINNKTGPIYLNTYYSIHVKTVGEKKVTVTIPDSISISRFTPGGWTPLFESGRLSLTAESENTYNTYDCLIIFNDNQIYNEEIKIYENGSDTPRVKIITQEKTSLRKGGEYEK